MPRRCIEADTAAPRRGDQVTTRTTRVNKLVDEAAVSVRGILRPAFTGTGGRTPPRPPLGEQGAAS